MSVYIFNQAKLNVAQLLAELGQGESLFASKLEPILLDLIPTHYTTAIASTGKAYFYKQLAFWDHVSQEDKERNFRTNENLLVANKHNSPLTYDAPDGKWLPASIGYQG